MVTQDSPTVTMVSLTIREASPMVGGFISSQAKVVVGGCRLLAGVSSIEVVPPIVVRKEGDIVGSLVTGSN